MQTPPPPPSNIQNNSSGHLLERVLNPPLCLFLEYTIIMPYEAKCLGKFIIHSLQPTVSQFLVLHFVCRILNTFEWDLYAVNVQQLAMGVALNATTFEEFENNFTNSSTSTVGPVLSERERVRMEFYQTYDVMTGVSIFSY